MIEGIGEARGLKHELEMQGVKAKDGLGIGRDGEMHAPERLSKPPMDNP